MLVSILFCHVCVQTLYIITIYYILPIKCFILFCITYVLFTNTLYCFNILYTTYLLYINYLYTTYVLYKNIILFLYNNYVIYINHLYLLYTLLFIRTCGIIIKKSLFLMLLNKKYHWYKTKNVNSRIKSVWHLLILPIKCGILCAFLSVNWDCE